MFRLIKHHLYLLQLENYNLSRYWRVVIKKIFSREKMRQQIVWTPKLSGVFAIGIFFQILTAYLIARPLIKDEVYLGLFPVVFFFLFALFSYLHFVFLSLAVLILKPVDFAVKTWIVNRAKNKMEQLYVDRHKVVIGITGSYGKTTMKEVLAAILEQRFTVLKTPESVNTPVGISRLILNSLNTDTQIFIAEMGAYRRGDIRALCEIAQPDIAILTGINEAHLERFGSIENTIEAKFEIVENSKSNALVVLNGDDARVRENYKNFAGGRRVEFYSQNSPQPSLWKREGVPLLGEYIWGVINACVIIAKELGMTDEEISRGIMNLKPVPHRLQLIENRAAGITVIDDSYNGNPDGVREAIRVLAGFTDRRKVYVTPGLVEMGERTREIHIEIGRQLAGVADVVILIMNSVTPFVAEGIHPSPPPSPARGEGAEPQVMWFNSAKEAHDSLANILKPGDVVMFQNDWPDNYL